MGGKNLSVRCPNCLLSNPSFSVDFTFISGHVGNVKALSNAYQKTLEIAELKGSEK